MTTSIIYIAGLYHSGSTLLDRLLTTSKETIGLGEIYKLITDGREKYCSCGEQIDNCDFWTKFNPKVIGRNASEDEIEELYEDVMNLAHEYFPEAKYIVDSSKCHPISNEYIYKNFKGLIYHTKKDATNLKVINLYRDPRGWVGSIQKREKRFKRNFIKKIIHRSNLMRLVRWMQWYLMHKRIRHFLKENNIQHINISYEGICFQTEKTLKKIKEFTGIEYEINRDLELKTFNSHISVGNPSRLEPGSNSHIRYDSKWLSNRFNIVDNLMFIL